ncbi:MAG: ABC transporter substrate-binding protein [Synergistaceae bacterium]|jgi:branched-chain amino acid transport system substrate-binding protein|nr:ABC transporter substrate-binding protein [Synergistaceae bacterium]
MMQRRLLRSRVSALFVLTLLVSVCVQSVPAKVAYADDDVIRIAVIGSITGVYAFGGNEVKNAIELAVEKRGTVLGKKIEFEAADANDASQVISEFERLYAKGFRVFMGTYAPFADFAVQGVVDEYGAILMSAAGWANELTANKIKNYFHWSARVGVFGTRMGEYMPQYAEKYLGVKKENLRVALIWNTNVEYVAIAAREGLKAAGITPVFEEGYPADRKDFTALVANLQSNKIDVLIPCQGSADGVPFRKKMVEMGYAPPMLFAMGLIYDQPDFGALGADVVDGCLVLSYTHPFINRDKARGLADFTESYKAKHGWYPLTHATQTYAATLFMFDMIEKAGAYDVDKIREAIESADVPKGQYPNYWAVKFDDYHRNLGAGDPLVIGQWQKGTLVPVGTDEIKVGEAIIPWDPSKL